MSTQKIIKLTTEGDCEGRSTKTIGLFLGSVDQIITFCIENNIKPYYNFSIKDETIINVSDVVPKVTTVVDKFGNVQYNTPKYLKEIADKNAALSKLSAAERRLLGL